MGRESLCPEKVSIPLLPGLEGSWHSLRDSYELRMTDAMKEFLQQNSTGLALEMQTNSVTVAQCSRCYNIDSQIQPAPSL